MKITLKLPDELYDELDLLTPEGERVERFIEKRLSLLARINPDRPFMYLNGDDLSALSVLFGGHIFKDPKDLIDYVRRTQTFRLKDALDIVLDTDLMAQLHQQSQTMGIPFNKYIQDHLNEALMFMVGVPLHQVPLPRS